MGAFQVSEEYQKIKIRKQEIDFDKIISYEIIENGKVVTETTSNTFTFGNSKTKEKSKQHLSSTKAVAGGLVGGGIGAGMGKNTTKGKTKHNIITTTSSKSEDVEYCTEMKIEIKTSDIANPLITFEVLHSKDRKDSIYYKNSRKDAQEIAAILDIIISNNIDK